MRRRINGDNLAVASKIILFTHINKATIPRAKCYFFTIGKLQLQSTFKNKIYAIILLR